MPGRGPAGRSRRSGTGSARTSRGEQVAAEIEVARHHGDVGRVGDGPARCAGTGSDGKRHNSDDERDDDARWASTLGHCNPPFVRAPGSCEGAIIGTPAGLRSDGGRARLRPLQAGSRARNPPPPGRAGAWLAPCLTNKKATVAPIRAAPIGKRQRGRAGDLRKSGAVEGGWGIPAKRWRRSPRRPGRAGATGPAGRGGGPAGGQGRATARRGWGEARAGAASCSSWPACGRCAARRRRSRRRETAGRRCGRGRQWRWCSRRA
jgi:hypothetical protein